MKHEWPQKSINKNIKQSLDLELTIGIILVLQEINKSSLFKK